MREMILTQFDTAGVRGRVSRPECRNLFDKAAREWDRLQGIRTGGIDESI